MLLALLRVVAASTDADVLEFVEGLVAGAVAVQPIDEKRISIAIGVIRALHGTHGIDYTQWLQVQLGGKRSGLAIVQWLSEKLHLEGGGAHRVRYLRLTIHSLRGIRAKG